MKPKFIVLDTKVVNGVILIYGGLLPTSDEFKSDSISRFSWYRLEDMKSQVTERKTDV